MDTVPPVCPAGTRDDGSGTCPELTPVGMTCSAGECKRNNDLFKEKIKDFIDFGAPVPCETWPDAPGCGAPPARLASEPRKRKRRRFRKQCPWGYQRASADNSECIEIPRAYTQAMSDLVTQTAPNILHMQAEQAASTTEDGLAPLPNADVNVIAQLSPADKDLYFARQRAYMVYNNEVLERRAREELARQSQADEAAMRAEYEKAVLEAELSGEPPPPNPFVDEPVEEINTDTLPGVRGALASPPPWYRKCRKINWTWFIVAFVALGFIIFVAVINFRPHEGLLPPLSSVASVRRPHSATTLSLPGRTSASSVGSGVLVSSDARAPSAIF